MMGTECPINHEYVSPWSVPVWVPYRTHYSQYVFIRNLMVQKGAGQHNALHPKKSSHSTVVSSNPSGTVKNLLIGHVFQNMCCWVPSRAHYSE